jgi:hypothetical protein
MRNIIRNIAVYLWLILTCIGLPVAGPYLREPWHTATVIALAVATAINFTCWRLMRRGYVKLQDGAADLYLLAWQSNMRHHLKPWNRDKPLADVLDRRRNG